MSPWHSDFRQFAKPRDSQLFNKNRWTGLRWANCTSEPVIKRHPVTWYRFHQMKHRILIQFFESVLQRVVFFAFENNTDRIHGNDPASDTDACVSPPWVLTGHQNMWKVSSLITSVRFSRESQSWFGRKWKSCCLGGWGRKKLGIFFVWWRWKEKHRDHWYKSHECSRKHSRPFSAVITSDASLFFFSAQFALRQKCLSLSLSINKVHVRRFNCWLMIERFCCLSLSPPPHPFVCVCVYCAVSLVYSAVNQWRRWCTIFARWKKLLCRLIHSRENVCSCCCFCENISTSNSLPVVKL